MRTLLFFLMNTIIVFATDNSRPKNHRFHDNNEELSLHGKMDFKQTIKTDNGLTSKGSKRDKSMIHARLKEEEDEYVNSWNLSKGTERVQFQVEGHEGPETYIFGFDTGDGKSRQYRLEERHPDGTVQGQYGYYDANGKLRIVRYTAKPFEGYTEKHHENNAGKLKT